MAVMRWDPWSELAALQPDVNQVFGRAGQTSTGRATGLVPPIDAYRTESGLVVRVELPGMRPEDVEVSVSDGMLTISGEKGTDTKVEEDSWVCRERAFGRFERSFSLPQGTDPGQITAAFEHGMLELHIPHPPERQPRKIEISGAASGQQTVDVEESSS